MDLLIAIPIRFILLGIMVTLFVVMLVVYAIGTYRLNKNSDIITRRPDEFEKSIIKVSKHFINYYKNKSKALTIDHTLGKKIAQSWDNRLKKNKDIIGLTVKQRKLLKNHPCVFYSKYKSSEWLDQIIKEVTNPTLKDKQHGI